MEDYAVIGKRLPRVDGIIKSAGEAKFVSDVKLPGQLNGRILRSPYAHAKILNIDTSRAQKLPGVRAVITAKDTPKIRYAAFGHPFPADRLPLQDERVRFVGDEVAAVAATDEDTAEEALSLIDVQYEVLPVVFDTEEALLPDAPAVHSAQGNLVTRISKNIGDTERGFAEADYIFEDRFETQPVAVGAMEPHNWLAQYDSGGRVTVWMGHQNAQAVRRTLAAALGISPSNLRIIISQIGGSFGSKTMADSEAIIASLLSQKTRRPVRIHNTREEEFALSGHRVAMKIIIKTGVSKEGKILAREVKLYSDAGAYHRSAIISTAVASDKAAQLYAPTNYRFEGLVVYTNNPPASPFRGFGGPQVHWAMESQMDMIAEKLGTDPMALRLANAHTTGQVLPCGVKISSSGMVDCIKRAAAEAEWENRRGKLGPNRGVGMACLIHTGGGSMTSPEAANYAEAVVKIDEAGMLNIVIAESEMGQGLLTTLTQIAAEELGVPVQDVTIGSGDTEAIPLSSIGVHASRATFTVGNAVRAAVNDAKKQLFEVVSEVLEASPEDLESRDRKIYVKGSPDKAVTLQEAVRTFYIKKRRPLTTQGYFDDPYSGTTDKNGYGNPSPAYAFAAQVAEVEVDTETGQITLKNFVAAHDVGMAINPMAAEGQIEGSVAIGLGFALGEELLRQNGATINANFHDYHIPTVQDIPPVRPILVEPIEPRGPFGAKGIGEPGLVPTAPAIANAIYDAIGVRIKSLPITHEKILEALKQKQGH